MKKGLIVIAVIFSTFFSIHAKNRDGGTPLKKTEKKKGPSLEKQKERVSHGKGSALKGSSRDKSWNRPFESIPPLPRLYGKKGRDERKARGVILKFHRWPDSKKKSLIFEELKKAGLKKTKTIKNFKIWLFAYSKGLKPLPWALNACKRLPKMSILDYCEPDTLLKTHNKVSRNPLFLPSEESFLADDSLLSPLLSRNKKTTEGSICLDCQFPKKETLNIPVNVRNCGLVSSSHSLRDGRLSDYWAQELIGSDLLREELKQVPPPNKKNWLAVFDNFKEDEKGKGREHGTLVRNLISDEGSHAVLPELGKNAFHLFNTIFSGDVTYAADQHRGIPSFINHSMGWELKNVYKAMKSLSPPSIVVVAAGNDFPSDLEKRKAKASKDFDAIFVGVFHLQVLQVIFLKKEKRFIFWLLLTIILLLPVPMEIITNLQERVELLLW